MASSGYIYTQVLSEESSAQHGPFYVTNVLQVHHQDLKVGRSEDQLNHFVCCVCVFHV